MAPVDEQGRYKMGTFAELSGLSPEILRAWERRHGLLQPARPSGGHRLYTDDDLRVIRRATALLEDGRSIGEVAALGRAALLDDAALGRAGLRSERAGPRPPPAAPPPGLAARIVEAALALDAPAVGVALDRAFATLSFEAVLSEVLEPAAHEIGARWARGELDVAAEHLVSAAVRARLEGLLGAMTRTSRGAPTVIAACLPGEEHELGILALAARLVDAGVELAYLGRDLPLPDLERSAERLAVRAVCLSVKRREVLLPVGPALAELARRWSGRIRIHLGGLAPEALPPSLAKAPIFVWGPGRRTEEILAELFPPEPVARRRR